ncbi:hypothetical protein EMCRGX_G012053 [Ephydatia muelleri]
MREVLLVPWTVFLLIKPIDGEFLLQPKSLISPLYGVAYFNCSVVNDTILGWNVQFGSGDMGYWPLHREYLSAKGFRVVQWQTGSRMDSILSVNATSTKNGTAVRSTVQWSGGIRFSDIAVLTVYGPPDPPQSLSIAAVADRKIVIKWTPPFSFGTWLLYKAVVKNMATEKMSESNWTYSETFEYRDFSSGPCNSYEFTVIAENSAGTSSSSQPLIATIPTVPQMESVHSVVQSRTSLATVSFYTKAQYCQDYSVEVYTIKLTAAGNGPIHVGSHYPSNDNDTEIVIQLQPNVKYIYTITAANAVGNSTSLPHTLYTTDVQSSTITGSDHQLNVTCFFAVGTLAKGCVVYLEKSGEVVYQMIPRVNGTAKGVIRTEFSVDCYNISVMDWEEDGSIGSLPVPVNSAISSILLHSGSQRCGATSVAALLSAPPTLSPTPVRSLLPTFSGLQPTSSDSSLMVERDNSSIEIISAGAICGVAILSVVMVVAMVLGCHLKTRKMVVSIVFPRSTEIHSMFTLPPQTSAIPKPEPYLSYHSALQLNRMNTMQTSSGPQPYEELVRPHKLSSSYIHAPSSDHGYAVLNQCPSYSTLESNPLQSDFIHETFHEYSELQEPMSNQYEPVEEAAVVYEGLYESVPTAGSNV